MSRSCAAQRAFGLEVLDKSPAEQRDAAFEWMRTHDRWLLVIDGVDNPPAMLEGGYSIPADIRGHVLLTSRARHFHDLGMAIRVRLQLCMPRVMRVCDP